MEVPVCSAGKTPRGGAMKIRINQQETFLYKNAAFNAAKWGHVFAGSLVEVRSVTGQSRDGNDRWYQDGNGNYLHSSFAEPVHEDIQPLADPYSNKVDWAVMFGIPAALGSSKGKGIKVAVLDTGIFREHPDLERISENNVMDVCMSRFGAEDITGHGTHCAGIIGANALGGAGVLGVAPECDLYSIKVIHENEGSKDWSVTAGIHRARELGISVVSLSLWVNETSGQLETAVAEALDSGMVLVAAAGDNQHIGPTKKILYPARHAGVIAVGAVNQKYYDQYRKQGYADGLDYVLPYQKMWSCGHKGEARYVQKAGSSMATALVSGLCALVCASVPTGHSLPRDRLNAIRAGIDGVCRPWTEEASLGEYPYRIMRSP